MNKEAFDLLLSTTGGKLANDFARIQQQQNANSLGARFGRTASGIGGAVAGGARAVGNAASGIAGGIAGGARAVGSGVAGAARQGAASLDNSIQSARAGVRGAQQATRAATDPARSAVSTMADVTRGNTPIATTTRPPAPASTYAGPTSSQFPSPPPQPPQYFSVNRPASRNISAQQFEDSFLPGQADPAGSLDRAAGVSPSPGSLAASRIATQPPSVDISVPRQGPGMRQQVTSFDQLPPEFQARFRERLASGSVQGANEQDAVASYNRHYAGTANQLRALSQQPRTAYGSLGRADRGLSQSASLGRLRAQA